MSKSDEMKELEHDLEIALVCKNLIEKHVDIVTNKIRRLVDEGTYEPSVREDEEFENELTELILESKKLHDQREQVETVIKNIHKKMDKLLTE